MILAPMLELSLRQSLALSNGSYTIFLERPIAAAMLTLAAVVALLNAYALLAKCDWRRRFGLGWQDGET